VASGWADRNYNRILYNKVYEYQNCTDLRFERQSPPWQVDGGMQQVSHGRKEEVGRHYGSRCFYPPFAYMLVSFWSCSWRASNLIHKVWKAVKSITNRVLGFKSLLGGGLATDLRRRPLPVYLHTPKMQNHVLNLNIEISIGNKRLVVFRIHTAVLGGTCWWYQWIGRPMPQFLG